MTQVVVIFDLDGTLQFGSPPGPISVHIVRQLIAAGARVGSISDRSLAEQKVTWDRQQVEVDFCSSRKGLAVVGRIFENSQCVLIGDSLSAHKAARQAGMGFIWADQASPVIRKFVAFGNAKVLIDPLRSIEGNED